MTPWEAFRQELGNMGYTLCRCPAGYKLPHNDFEQVFASLLNGIPLKQEHAPHDNAAADLEGKIVHISVTMDVVLAGVAGLHELGHAANGHKFRNPDHLKQYEMEKAAWDWAESKMPSGWEDTFRQIRKEKLASYECPCVKAHVKELETGSL